jgi:dTDP-4-amino-4,6-dideoxygalactose transaminase
VKLKNLDQYNASRQLAAQRYDELFASIPQLQPPVRVGWSNHTFHQYTLRLIQGDRKVLLENLATLGIPAMVYYPIPLHKQIAFKPYITDSNKTYPASLKLSEQVFSLPIHTELSLEMQQYIAQNVIKSLG